MPPKELPAVALLNANDCIPEIAADCVWAIIALKGFTAAPVPAFIPNAGADPIPAEDAFAPKLKVGRLLEVLKFVTGVDRLDPSSAISIDEDSFSTELKLLLGWFIETGPSAAAGFGLKLNSILPKEVPTKGTVSEKEPA